MNPFDVWNSWLQGWLQATTQMAEAQRKFVQEVLIQPAPARSLLRSPASQSAQPSSPAAAAATPRTPRHSPSMSPVAAGKTTSSKAKPPTRTQAAANRKTTKAVEPSAASPNADAAAPKTAAAIAVGARIERRTVGTKTVAKPEAPAERPAPAAPKKRGRPPKVASAAADAAALGGGAPAKRRSGRPIKAEQLSSGTGGNGGKGGRRKLVAAEPSVDNPVGAGTVGRGRRAKTASKRDAQAAKTPARVPRAKTAGGAGSAAGKRRRGGTAARAEAPTAAAATPSETASQRSIAAPEIATAGTGSAEGQG